MATPQPAKRPGRQLAAAGRSGTARLNAAAVVLWRAPGTLQLELGSRSVVVDNVSTEQVSALLPPPARAAPIPQLAPNDPRLQELTEVLDAAGFLTSRPPAATRRPDRALAAHLVPELAALTGRHGDAAGPLLANRQRSAVAVHGTSRITATIASTLAAAGVGWVQLVHGGEVSAADACPGGLSPADEGTRFGIAGVAAIQRSASGVDTAPMPASRLADLVILTDPLPVEPSVRASLHLDGLSHLSATVEGSRAVVGPLVVPGVSSCLHCADLHRCERDPRWPALAVQLSSRPKRRLSSEVAVCVAVAGLAAGQALAYLDRQHPETTNATLEWQLPDWRLRRRSWPPHRDCDCGAVTKSAVPTPPNRKNTAE